MAACHHRSLTLHHDRATDVDDARAESPGVAPLLRHVDVRVGAVLARHEERKAHDHGRGHHTQPDRPAKGRQPRQDADTRVTFLGQDAATILHEGNGEVNDGFSDAGDRVGAHPYIYFLCQIKVKIILYLSEVVWTVKLAFS